VSSLLILQAANSRSSGESKIEMLTNNFLAKLESQDEKLQALVRDTGDQLRGQLEADSNFFRCIQRQRDVFLTVLSAFLPFTLISEYFGLLVG